MVAICWWAPLKEMGGMLGEGLQKPAVSRNVWGVEERELSKDRRFEARASRVLLECLIPYPILERRGKIHLGPCIIKSKIQVLN